MYLDTVACEMSTPSFCRRDSGARARNAASRSRVRVDVESLRQERDLPLGQRASPVFDVVEERQGDAPSLCAR